MPVLSKKGIIKSLWVDLLCLAFLGLGEAACFHWELGLWVTAVDPAFIAGHQNIMNCGIWIDQLDHCPAMTSWHLSFWSSLSTFGTNFMQIFHIFSSSWIIVCTVPTLTSNYVLIVSIDTLQSLSMKFFIWPINSGVLTSLLLPHLSSSLTDSLLSLNLLCHSKTNAQFMQDAPKAIWSIPYNSVAFFQSLKQNFIEYHFSKVSSRPDCIIEIHQLWQSSFLRVYSNCCCNCSFEAEIIKIGQSSHKMYSNNILNFQESMTILNACTTKSGNLLKASCISLLQDKKLLL